MRGRPLGTVGSRGPLKPEKFFISPPSEQPLVPILDDGSEGWLVGFQQTEVAIAATLALNASMTAAAQPVYLPDELPTDSTDPIEYLRPTADTTAATGVGCVTGTNVASSSMSAVYSGKSGAGPTGSSAQLTATFSSSIEHNEQRIFSAFQSPTHSYSSLTLNISISYIHIGSGVNSAQCMFYSTDSGSTYTSLGTITTSQKTFTVDITGADLTKVQVLVIAVSPTATGSTTDTVYDIWTAGNYTTGITFDDDSAEGFWAGVQNCAASVALSTCLAATALSTACAQSVVDQHQDDPAGHLYGQYDEDFWQNQVPPVTLTMGKIYLPDPEEIPAHTLYGQPDEDFWQNWVAPVPPSLGPLYLPDPEEIPARTLHGQPDEDFWPQFLLPPPAQAALYQKLPLGDPEEIPAATLHGQSDEDFWVNAVAPVPLSLGNLYLPDPEELPAATLHGQPDEDYWQNWTVPTVLSMGNLYLPDPEEIPAGSLHGQPDEDYWQNWVSPVTASIYQLLPIGDPEEIPAGSLHGQPDEDLWVNWVSSVSITLQWPNPWQFEQNEPGNLYGQPVEEYWVNPVFPVQSTIRWPQQWKFEQNDPTTLHGQPDEDFWTNSVFPLQSTYLWPQQWTFENPAFYISPIPPGTIVVITRNLRTYPQVFSNSGLIENQVEARNYSAYSEIESSSGEVQEMIESAGFVIIPALAVTTGQVVDQVESSGFTVYRQDIVI